MKLKEISLQNFRNYKESSIPFHEKINFIRGNNGEGKTNLLEGIYILSMGKSFRTAKDIDMIGFDSEFFRVEGKFEKDGYDLPIEISLSKREKKFKVDGVDKTKNADLLENVYMVVFSPEDLKIVKEDPEKRRRFIDRELFQLVPMYYKNISRYRKVLKNRNVTLKEDKINHEMLDIWDGYIIDIGSDIILNRHEFILKLAEQSKAIHSKITSGKEDLKVTYEPSIEIDRYQEKKIKEILIENREKDIALRQTTVGPHRDDIKIEVNDIDIRHFGSQGQQRTAALSLKLAELQLIKDETGENAILLLDDVLSELDANRQEFLISAFERNQLFITAAEMSDDLRDKMPPGKEIFIEKGDIR